MLPSLTWKTLVRKNKKKEKLCSSFKSIIFVKNISCLYFSPIAKLWPWKNVIFKVFVFWRYSKTLSLPEFSSMYIPIIKQLSCTADFRNISDNFSNLSVIDTLHDVDLHMSRSEPPQNSKFKFLHVTKTAFT